MFDDAHTPVETQTLVAWLDRIASQHTANRIATGEDLSPEIQDAYQQLETLRAVLLGQATTESALATLRLVLDAREYGRLCEERTGAVDPDDLRRPDRLLPGVPEGRPGLSPRTARRPHAPKRMSRRAFSP